MVGTNDAPNGSIEEFEDGAIPYGAIRLSDVHGRVQEALETTPDRTFPVDDEWKQELEDCRKLDEEMHDPGVLDDDLRAYLRHGRRANLILRDAFGGELLNACVIHPNSGAVLKLPKTGWLSSWDGYISHTVSDDIDRTHPDSDGAIGTLLVGYRRPVFVMKDEFESWFAERFQLDQKPKVGRPPGSGSLKFEDEKLYQIMRAKISSGEAHSVNRAAELVAADARGAGTRESKARRLAIGYRRWIRESEQK